MAIRVETVTDPSQLTASIRDQWNHLPLPSPMQSTEWLLAWWDTFGNVSTHQLRIQLVFDGERLVAVAPLYLSNSWMTPGCLRFLGDDLTCSDHATILIAPTFQDDAIAALSKHIASEAGTLWHTMHLDSVDQSDETVRKFVDQLVESGCDLHIRKTDGCWSGSLPATWDDYLKSLSKNHRKRCRRWQRAYFDTGRATIVRRSIDELSAGWKELAKLNEERRKKLGDRSAFVDQRFHQFHLSVLPQLVAGGKAELRELHIDGELKSAEYVLFHQGTIFCYQSGMKTDDNRDGYGNLSILALVRDAIASGYKQFDFLRGDEEYKHHWRTERADCVHYHLGTPSLKGKVHVAWHRTRHWMRMIRDSLLQSSA